VASAAWSGGNQRSWRDADSPPRGCPALGRHVLLRQDVTFPGSDQMEGRTFRYEPISRGPSLLPQPR
jgi:hypothetical protein